MHFKMSSEECRPICLGLNVLRRCLSAPNQMVINVNKVFMAQAIKFFVVPGSGGLGGRGLGVLSYSGIFIRSGVIKYETQLKRYNPMVYLWSSFIFFSLLLFIMNGLILDEKRSIDHLDCFWLHESTLIPVITSIIKCGMKLLIHSQTSTLLPLKFRNGRIISSYSLLYMWLLIHAYGICCHNTYK